MNTHTHTHSLVLGVGSSQAASCVLHTVCIATYVALLMGKGPHERSQCSPVLHLHVASLLG